WDAYNVTEDADLGLRLARAGYRCKTLRSTTLEEAPVSFRPWLCQRTRWMKGWIQTYLVHMRAPGDLLRRLGPVRFLGIQA
ncbi:glycosyltransferase family 2 protein, partial [Klebsiella pneumoniae]